MGKPVMEKFKDIYEGSFGWSAGDHETRLLLPEVTARIRDLATKDTATRGGSKCRACGSRITSGMQRCLFQWLRNGWGWSAPSFVHAKAEDCTKVEVLDAHQQAAFMARGILGETSGLQPAPCHLHVTGVTAISARSVALFQRGSGENVWTLGQSHGLHWDKYRTARRACACFCESDFLSRKRVQPEYSRFL